MCRLKLAYHLNRVFCPQCIIEMCASGEWMRLACSQEMAVGTEDPTTQQDPSFQFPAPLSTPFSFRVGTGKVAAALEKIQHLCDMAERKLKTRKWILSKAIFVIMIVKETCGDFKHTNDPLIPHFGVKINVHFESKM